MPPSFVNYSSYENGLWVIPPNQVIDPVNDTITFSTDGFSPYALAAVPEPGTLRLLAVAVTGVIAYTCRRRKRPALQLTKLD